MKIFVLALAFLTLTLTASAQVKYVSPYIRSDGTYVGGHYRDTSNDGNYYNNANYIGDNDNSYSYRYGGSRTPIAQTWGKNKARTPISRY